MLILLTVSEEIVSYRKKNDVWLPELQHVEDIIDEFKKHLPDVGEATDEKQIDEESKRVFNQRNNEAKDLSRRIIGKFTQGGKNCDYKRYSSRLIMDSVEYDFVIKDAVSKNIYVDREDAFLSDGTKLGTIVTYSDGYKPLYAHLRSSLLGYASINLFSMINRFPDTAVMVSTDSFYINAKHRDAVTRAGVHG